MFRTTDYDKCQLNLMLRSLISFENKQIPLSTLVGNLEFLLSALEVVSEDWEEKFLDEITTLETINARSIIKEAGEPVTEIEESQKQFLIKQSVNNLKNIIEESVFL